MRVQNKDREWCVLPREGGGQHCNLQGKRFYFERDFFIITHNIPASIHLGRYFILHFHQISKFPFPFFSSSKNDFITYLLHRELRSKKILMVLYINSYIDSCPPLPRITCALFSRLWPQSLHLLIGDTSQFPLMHFWLWCVSSLCPWPFLSRYPFPNLIHWWLRLLLYWSLQNLYTQP